MKIFFKVRAEQKNENCFSRSGVGKKMNIFLQGGQKNEHFFQGPAWAKK